MFLNGFNKEQQRALQEAIYYAAETGHLEVALDLRKIGLYFLFYQTYFLFSNLSSKITT